MPAILSLKCRLSVEDITFCKFMVDPLKDHLGSQHKPFSESQIQEIKSLINEVTQFFKIALLIIEDEKFEKIENLKANRIKLVNFLYEIEKVKIKRIKIKEVNTRNSLLCFKSLAETKNMLIQSVNLVKSYRDYIMADIKPP